MTKVLLIALLALTFIPLRADNWIQNGDFADGVDHWYGNGRPPSDFAPENPLDTPDPFTSKGLIIPLKHAEWTKVAQDFKGKSHSGVMTVTYMVSTDLKFSAKPDDYVNMPAHIDYTGWQPFNTPPGQWIIFLSDFGSRHGAYYEIAPKLGSSAPQTIRIPISGLTPLQDKTIALAFPPGTGTVVLLGVYMTDN
ncbi:MAG: hypothetical protein LV480_00740 [Methylacidiphilales bacterium]|nr:hypothetical protein [Candidatus Methylacidiphilales bacterium]